MYMFHAPSPLSSLLAASRSCRRLTITRTRHSISFIQRSTHAVSSVYDGSRIFVLRERHSMRGASV